MNRAYSLIEIKRVDEDQRIIEGIATTPEVDLVDDIVEPDGAEFKLPLPLLWQHDSRQPLGHVTHAKVTKAGIEIRAKIAKIEEEGPLKNRIDEAWQAIRAGLVRGLSIGFKGLETSRIEGTFGTRFIRWLWLELSAVTIPANSEATITAIKSFDAELLAASGRTEDGADSKPDASGTKTEPSAAAGKRKPVNLRPKEATMNIAEQIAALEAKRAANAARMEEIMQLASKEGRSTNEAEQEEFDNLSSEIDTVDKDLKRFRDLEKVKRMMPVEVKSSEDGSKNRGGEQEMIVLRQPKPAPGIQFARVARCLALAHLQHRDVQAIAKELYPHDPLIEKAAVPAATTNHTTWAKPLVGDETAVFADFVEWLRPQTILGRFGANGIPSLRRVPFRVPLISQDSGGAGYWVGEGKGKPLTKFDFSRRVLEPLKVANIAVATKETLRDSSPSAEMIIRDQLAAALRERLDTDFIDPEKAAAAGVSPAAITNGIALTHSSGQTAAKVRDDIRTLFNAFIAADNPPSSGVFIMSSQTALALSLMVNSLGQPEFAGITMNGGTFFGLPVITSEFVGNYASSPAQFTYSYVFLVNANDIYFADEGGITVDMSTEASLNMADTQTMSSGSPPVGSSSMVSLWQTNSVGFLAERELNWLRRRTSAVAGLDRVAWGQGLS